MVPAYAASAQPGDAILGVQDSSGIPLPVQREKCVCGGDKTKALALRAWRSPSAQPLGASRPGGVPHPATAAVTGSSREAGCSPPSPQSPPCLPARRQGLAPGTPRCRGGSSGAITPPGWPRRDGAAQPRQMAAGPDGTRNYNSRHAPRLALAQDAPRGDPRSLAPARCDATEVRRTPPTREAGAPLPGRPRLPCPVQTSRYASPGSASRRARRRPSDPAALCSSSRSCRRVGGELQLPACCAARGGAGRGGCRDAPPVVPGRRRLRRRDAAVGGGRYLARASAPAVWAGPALAPRPAAQPCDGAGAA